MVSPCWQIYNLFGIYDHLQYFDYINTIRHVEVTPIILDFPMHYRIDVLPYEIRQQAIDSIDKCFKLKIAKQPTLFRKLHTLKKILQDTEDHIFERNVDIDPEDMFANGGRIGLKDGNGVADEEAENAKFVKRVKELMDEGFDMGEAVREAMKEGYAEGGRTGFFMGSKLPQGLALVRQMLKFFSEGSKTGKTGSEMLKIVSNSSQSHDNRTLNIL
mgnify:CR=1 FL=1